MEGRREVIKMAMLESIGKREVEAMLNLVPGLKFHPTDEELIVHYLRYKVATNRIPVSIIGEVDLYKYDPWDLPEKAVFGQQEWYFFTLLDKRHPNGSRPSRAAGRGYWRATGADKPIISQQEGPDPIGIKKSLVFYHGKSPNGTKTDWIMHEYRLPNSSNSDEKGKRLGVVDDWVLCRLHNKKNGWQKNEVVQQQVDRHPDTCFTPTPDHVESPNKNGMNPNLSPQAETSSAYNSASTESEMLILFKKYIDWYASLIVDDVPTSFEPFQPMVQAGLDTPMQDLCFPSVTSPF